MQFIPIKTRTIIPPQDDLFTIFDDHIQYLQEGDLVFITSKILAIHQGRCLPVQEVNKAALVEEEADQLMIDTEQDVTLTIKNNTFIPWAGIDESNANGHYILWPDNVEDLLCDLHGYLCQKFDLKHLGIIATDSSLLPFRRGLVGISIGFYGFNPLRDYRNKPDLFGRPLYMTQTNIVDSLSSMAVLLMGEGQESIPMVIARDIVPLDFSESDYKNSFNIPPEEDLFQPFFKLFQSKIKR